MDRGTGSAEEVRMLIRDILNLKGGVIHRIGVSDSLAEAVARMAAHDVGSLVVMEGGAMRGMLTFREVLRALDAFGAAFGGTAVREIMESDPVCGAPGDTIDDLRELMTRHHIRYLPVKKDGVLVGIISFHDVAKAVIMQTDMENRLLRRYIESQPEAAVDRG
jgi:predicted transcriptional regulator